MHASRKAKQITKNNIINSPTGIFSVLLIHIFMKMSLVAEGRVDFRHVELGQLSKLRSEKAD